MNCLRGGGPGEVCGVVLLGRGMRDCGVGVVGVDGGAGEGARAAAVVWLGAASLAGSTRLHVMPASTVCLRTVAVPASRRGTPSVLVARAAVAALASVLVAREVVAARRSASTALDTVVGLVGAGTASVLTPRCTATAATTASVFTPRLTAKGPALSLAVPQPTVRVCGLGAAGTGTAAGVGAASSALRLRHMRLPASASARTGVVSTPTLLVRTPWRARQPAHSTSSTVQSDEAASLVLGAHDTPASAVEGRAVTPACVRCTLAGCTCTPVSLVVGRAGGGGAGWVSVWQPLLAASVAEVCTLRADVRGGTYGMSSVYTELLDRRFGDGWASSLERHKRTRYC